VPRRVLFAVGLLGGLLAAVGLTAVAAPLDPVPAPADAGRVAAAAASPAPVAGGTSPVPNLASPAADGLTPASETCAPAPLRDRAGQVLLVGLPEVTAADDPLVAAVSEAGVGGILLTDANVVDAAQVRDLVAGARARAAHGLLVATDEEPGRVSSFGALVGRSSSARTLARRGTPPQVRTFAAELGRSLRGLGVDLDLAPVADLDGGPAGGVIGDRAFSADPETAAAFTLAFARGLADGGILPTVKHFPGHGRSTTDSHAALARVDATIDELRPTDLAPFSAAIDADAPVVMLNHVAYGALDPDLPASLSPRAYALLRELGFDGVAMTDSVGMGAVNLRWPFPEAAVMAVRAGADAVLATDGNHALAMRDALVAAVESGELPAARLDQAVARMLALKGEDPRTLVCFDADLPTGLAPRPARATR
jgi:beta-N-acetylhexosaminidase